MLARAVGSTTNRARLAPVSEAITGHPIPGEPSQSTSSRFCRAATCPAVRRSCVTSLPEFSAATPNWAWTIGPQRVSDTNHSPQTAGSNSIAFSAQKSKHTPQPSQAIVSTRKVLAPAVARPVEVDRVETAQLLALAARRAMARLDPRLATGGETLPPRDARLEDQVQVSRVHVAIGDHGFFCQRGERRQDRRLPGAAFAADDHKFLHTCAPGRIASSNPPIRSATCGTASAANSPRE